MKLDESLKYWMRAIFFIFALACLLPCLFFDEIPLGGAIFILLFQLSIVPLLLYHSLWRKVVSINLNSKQVILSYGPLFPVFKKYYPASYFDELEIKNKKEVLSSTADSFSDRTGVKVTTSFSLIGRIVLELVEYSYSASDIEREKYVKLKQDEIVKILTSTIPNLKIS